MGILLVLARDMGHKWGYPKWRVNKGKSHLEMDDVWGYPHLWTPPVEVEAFFSWALAKHFMGNLMGIP